MEILGVSYVEWFGVPGLLFYTAVVLYEEHHDAEVCEQYWMPVLRDLRLFT